jgi:hypothetical protein
MNIAKKQYEIECTRNNVTPKVFYNYCKKRAALKGCDIESWLEYSFWSNPLQKQQSQTYLHEDWETPLKETNKYMPYDWHLYLEKTYNLIMEFEFDTDTVGHGYFYLTEYEV